MHFCSTVSAYEIGDIVVEVEVDVEVEVEGGDGDNRSNDFTGEHRHMCGYEFGDTIF